jgi:hypothetical protein
MTSAPLLVSCLPIKTVAPLPAVYCHCPALQVAGQEQDAQRKQAEAERMMEVSVLPRPPVLHCPSRLPALLSLQLLLLLVRLVHAAARAAALQRCTDFRTRAS